MLSREQVSRIAQLARLELAPAEAELMLAELNAILAVVDRLGQVDTAGIEPMAHPQEASQRLREDRATEPDRHAEYQQAAPAVEDGLYLVPKVIE
jgi:aspartyl-tRNA(Asn)/glutamyl-tRNA(Gln) amidotransferase subunit C